MSQGLNITNNEAYLQDTTGSLFSGSKIYLQGAEVNYEINNFLSIRPKVAVDFETQSGESQIGDQANYERRKTEISYQGFEVPVITISGMIDLNNMSGSRGTDIQTVTPGKLRTMNFTPKTYYFRDDIGSALMNDPNSDVPSPYTSGSGIPVTFESLNFTRISDDTNIVDYEITLWEDKD